MSDGRQHEIGDVVDGLEVVGVNYQDTEEHGRHKFEYVFRDHKELERERKEEKALAEAREADRLKAEEMEAAEENKLQSELYPEEAGDGEPQEG